VEQAGRKPECATFIEPELSFAGCLAVLFVDIGAINSSVGTKASLLGFSARPIHGAANAPRSAAAAVGRSRLRMTTSPVSASR
jgi:hypothetical protein